MVDPCRDSMRTLLRSPILRTTAIAQDPLPQNRVGDTQIAADQNDQIGLFEVLVRVGWSVEKVPPLSRSSGDVARSSASRTASASEPFGQAMPMFTG